MIDPEAGLFRVSWQDWNEESERGEFLEEGGEIKGATAAIAWARSRTDRVLIRLAHTNESYYSAGSVPETLDDERPLPEWPPIPPRGGVVDSSG